MTTVIINYNNVIIIVIIIIIYTYCVPECRSSSLMPLFQSIHGNSGHGGCGGSEQGVGGSLEASREPRFQLVSGRQVGVKSLVFGFRFFHMNADSRSIFTFFIFLR